MMVDRKTFFSENFVTLEFDENYEGNDRQIGDGSLGIELLAKRSLISASKLQIAWTGARQWSRGHDDSDLWHQEQSGGVDEVRSRGEKGDMLSRREQKCQRRLEKFLDGHGHAFGIHFKSC